MAPEVMTSDSYDAAADVYSYGIVLWQLFTEKEPYHDLTTNQIFTAVESVRCSSILFSQTLPEGR